MNLPGVSLTLCCFVVYSARRFVVCLSVCHFVLVFFSPFSIAITSLGEERANLSAFRTFVRFVLVWICRFSLPLGGLGGGAGAGGGGAAVCGCGTPLTFLLPFLNLNGLNVYKPLFHLDLMIIFTMK